MIREAKKTAHSYLDSHFYLMFPIYVIWLITTTINQVLTWVLLPYLFASWVSLFIYRIVLCFAVTLCFSPLYIGILKAALLAIKNQPVSVLVVWGFYKNKTAYKNAVMVCLIPQLLSSFGWSCHLLIDSKLVVALVQLVVFIFSSLFFLSGYRLVLSEDNCFNAIKTSFGIMSSNWVSYLLFEFSFVLWYALAIGIGMIIGLVFHIGTTAMNNATQISSGLLYGVGVYLYPYLFLARAVYADKLLAKQGQKKPAKLEKRAQVLTES